MQRDSDEADHGDGAHAHDQPLCIRGRRKLKGAHDPLLVRYDKQQDEDHCSHQPVQDNEDPQYDVRDR